MPGVDVRLRRARRSGGIDADGEAVVFQMMANQAGNVGIVFDNENAWFHEIIVAKAVAAI